MTHDARGDVESDDANDSEGDWSALCRGEIISVVVYNDI